MAVKHYIPKLGEPSAEARALSFSPLLPTERVSLLQLRLYVRQRCLEDFEFRQAIIQACELDPVLFIQMFCYFHETRELELFDDAVLGTFPVCLDCDQRDIIAWLKIEAGKRDILGEKSRGIGFSYLICAFFVWVWLFKGEKLDLGMVSKDKVALDNGRPSSLMGKLDIIIGELPAWMLVNPDGSSLLKRTKGDSIFRNMRNGNAILGYASTDEKLRSARFYMVALDEAAFFDGDFQRWVTSAHGTSPCIIWLSTHNGRAQMFYRLSVNPKMTRISSWWWDNSRCSRGLYVSKKGVIEILDKNFKWPTDYPFSHEYSGKLRSPFADSYFDRPGADPQCVLEELYGIAALDTRRLFTEAFIDRARKICTPPLYIGDINKEGDFEENMHGEWQLWLVPGTSIGSYTIGGDPALGTAGAAYAAIVAFDNKTGMQVLSGQFSECQPVDFARRLVAVAKFLTGPRGFGYCKIVPESTGIGGAVMAELHRLRYPNIWEDGNKLGVHNRDCGEQWLIELGRAIQDREVFVKDERILDELDLFEYDLLENLDWAGTDGHADLAMACAIGWHGCKERRRVFVEREKQKKQVISPEQEPAWREIQRRRHLWSSQYSEV